MTEILHYFNLCSNKQTDFCFQNKYPNGKDEVNVDANIKYNKEVTCIKWNNVPANKVLVECSDGSSYAADHVILTVSLGVLKEKAHSMFYPALPPQKLKTIEVS
jgi:hypothetical protein